MRCQRRREIWWGNSCWNDTAALTIQNCNVRWFYENRDWFSFWLIDSFIRFIHSSARILQARQAFLVLLKPYNIDNTLMITNLWLNVLLWKMFKSDVFFVVELELEIPTGCRVERLQIMSHHYLLIFPLSFAFVTDLANPTNDLLFIDISKPAMVSTVETASVAISTTPRIIETVYNQCICNCWLGIASADESLIFHWNLTVKREPGFSTWTLVHFCVEFCIRQNSNPCSIRAMTVD